MFLLKKVNNWTKSSVTDDKTELEVYQLFKNQISSIKERTNKYIKEYGNEDKRLLINFNNEIMSINVLEAYKQSMANNKNMGVMEKAKKVADLTYFYEIKLKELEGKIIQLALTESDNVYLITIANDIKILNDLLRKYAHLLAIQRSGVSSINNVEDIRRLKDIIEIRISEIESRLSLENMNRR